MIRLPISKHGSPSSPTALSPATRRSQWPMSMEPTYACGPRCIPSGCGLTRPPAKPTTPMTRMSILSVRSYFYVTNATIDDHHVPDHVACLAASAFGLQGRSAQAGGKEYVASLLQLSYLSQFCSKCLLTDHRRRAWENPGLKHGRSRRQDGRVCMFNAAPRIQIPGTVFWPYAVTLLIAIAGAHSVIAFSVIWFTRHIIVEDDSKFGGCSIDASSH